jgi:hypothetical protein
MQLPHHSGVLLCDRLTILSGVPMNSSTASGREHESLSMATSRGVSCRTPSETCRVSHLIRRQQPFWHHSAQPPLLVSAEAHAMFCGHVRLFGPPQSGISVQQAGLLSPHRIGMGSLSYSFFSDNSGHHGRQTQAASFRSHNCPTGHLAAILILVRSVGRRERTNVHHRSTRHRSSERKAMRARGCSKTACCTLRPLRRPAANTAALTRGWHLCTDYQQVRSHATTEDDARNSAAQAVSQDRAGSELMLSWFWARPRMTQQHATFDTS